MAETPPLNPASLYGAVDLSSLVQRASAPAGQAPQAQAGGTPGQAAAPAAGEPVATLPDVVVDADEQTLEQFMQLSQFLPVIVEMHAAWSSDAQALSPVLAKIVRGAEGRVVLVRVNLDAHPQLGQQPQVIAIIGGRPLQLFSGNPPEEQITQIVGEILQVAAQQGLTGHVAVDGAPQDDAEAQEPATPPLPPLHAEAFEALERGDYAAAVDAYERALAERPADDEARAGLAQVQLLVRLQGKTLEEIRQRAAAAPDDLDAQLDVADLDLSGGHIDDAFDRLLTLFPKLDAEGKTTVRERLLDLFLVVGVADPRVGAARARLTNLLF
ncbi:tetratricopeptide repeat protein [Pseudoclavibacter terrae]|uniref:Tetratricopeptide repeat protein n=1 Tax=Pseudoclavibacter terrae TaxID=1530195 RepID=A0A7J5AY18_9MICO|nr:tetratricopeptide repeat protein [Pseudoclavibacter terrae]KAB1636371.1 tetratricopeptide repeat protein [Pseudoclavibacter terrae]